MHLTISILRIGLLGLFLFCALRAFPQVPTTQDCLGAIPICQEVYQEDKSPTGSGNYTNGSVKWDGTVAGEELDTGVYVWRIN